ncbi:hypothetical protein [Gluconacetobacter johannae]|nr:hypothetical protein [Gluconacetobacter johannae]
MTIGISMDWGGIHVALERIAAIGAQPAPLSKPRAGPLRAESTR